MMGEESVRQVSASKVYREGEEGKIPWPGAMQATCIARRLLAPLGESIAWWATLFIVCLILIAPLTVVDVPPLLDYPNHLARAYVLAHGQANFHLSQMYAPHWAIIPNLAIDLLLPPLLLIMPVHTAGRILLAVALVMPVAGTILYSQAVFGRRSYWPLASGLVACNGLFLLGFINFQLGIGLALVCAGAWRTWREARPLAAAALGVVSAVSLFFSHLMGLLFFLILILSHEIERARNVRQPHHSVTSSLRCIAWVIPLILVSLALYASSAFAAKAAEIAWEIWQNKVIHAAMSVVNYNLFLDTVTACVLVIVLLTLATLRRIIVPLGSIIALSGTVVLFMVAPFGFKGTGYVDARFAVMFGFLLFGAVLPDRVPRKIGFLVGSSMLALFSFRTAQTWVVWDLHGRDLDQFRSAMSAIEPGSRVLLAAVDAAEAAPARRELLHRQYLSDGSRLDGHTAALLLIERHAFWPFLFANQDQQPIKLLPPYSQIAQNTVGIPNVRLLSAPFPDPYDVERFPLEGQWSCCYDYVLLMEAGSRPEFHHDNLDVVYQSDYASLFRVKQHVPFVPISPPAATDKILLSSPDTDPNVQGGASGRGDR
jgi:hypothetical protein